MRNAPSTREAARIELIRGVALTQDAHERAFANAVQLSARTLNVERVGVWMLDKGGTHIQCIMLYTLASDRLGGGDSIDLASCPAYARALREWRTIAADDALNDTRTRELAPYLREHGIGAMLDSPIFREGEPVGILCHENVGEGPRTWSKRDAHFAATVSDMIGLYMEQALRHRADQALLDTQAELERARVMESLGRMATAVAHDFNNVLMAISARSALVNLPKTDDQPGRAAYSEEIQILVEQGARLVRQLVAFAQPQPSVEARAAHAVTTDLCQVLREMGTFLRTLEVDGVAVVVRTPAEKLELPLRQAELEQIITNLAVNARDAMLGGGTLTIEGALVEGTPEAGRVVLRVIDTGVGMDEFTRRRIFEPFFSTKGEKIGRGIGLASVYRLVTDSGGTIQVQTGIGQGTSFVMEWPNA